jgi:hypothetical protein
MQGLERAEGFTDSLVDLLGGVRLEGLLHDS